MTESGERFPKTVFVKELPDEYDLAELTELMEKFGDILEVQVMADNHVLIRYQDGEAARRAVSRASGKNGNKIKFMGKKLHVIPKRNRTKE